MSNKNNELARRDMYGTDPFFNDFFNFPFFENRKNHHPIMKTDIKTNENSYTLTIDVPGFSKDEINSLCLILSGSLIIFVMCFILILGSVIQMIYPSIDKLLNIVDSKYELVHIAARRSKEISRTGYLQMPASSYKSKKNIGRALEEITEGLIEIKRGEK